MSSELINRISIKKYDGIMSLKYMAGETILYCFSFFF